VHLAQLLGWTNRFQKTLADADGSVHTYKVGTGSINDTDTWVVNNGGNHRNLMMPRDLAR
jgi:hypothetical protein